MHPIPKGPDEQQRLIDMMAEAVEHHRGVAGFAAVMTERRGSAIGPHGGIMDDVEFDKVLIRMRASSISSYGGKLIIVCTIPDEQWRIARLSAVRGRLPELLEGMVFSDEQDAQEAVFRLRLDQFPARDGMPEHFTPGWKKPGGDNWGPV